jgi:glycosyltransferase involved in cell wall biosynthesis
MARVLVLCESYPSDLSSGGELRFQNLCQQIARHNETYLLCFGAIPDGIDPGSHIGVHDYHTLPPIPTTGQSFRRHLRVSNARFLERGVPHYLRETQKTVARLASEWQIDTMVCMVQEAAEILMPIELPKLIDCCDSRTLTGRRMLKNRGSEMSLYERLATYVNYLRQRQAERARVRHFDRTTTISAADRECLLEVAGVDPSKITVIPNGVSRDALNVAPLQAPRRRSVVFWGNLDFPPNWTAVHFFNKMVFLPYLAERGVEWHIIGKGADDSIRELAEHPLVHLHGFVEDLYGEISSHGAMINPMVEGSGLKNKVLEAFACHLPVVSTSLGIEAVGADAGQHYLAADKPGDFAAAVMRCLEDEELTAAMTAEARSFVEDRFEWSAIGEGLNRILREIAP